MFSGFWEQAYVQLFEGATILTPLIHPQTDTTISCTWKNPLSWLPSHRFSTYTDCTTNTYWHASWSWKVYPL